MKYILNISIMIMIAFAPFVGQFHLDFSQIFEQGQHSLIFWDIRVPRVMLAFFVGGILSLGGLVFQTIFKNPMATPFTLGVASGATLFSAIGIVLGVGVFLSLFTFLGAISTVFILFSISFIFGTKSNSSLLLIGIAISFFYSALLMILFFISDLQESYEIVRFTMGSLEVVGFGDIYLVGIVAVFILLFLIKQRFYLKLLLTSDEFVLLRGVKLTKLNYLFLSIISFGIAVAVSVVGPIGFIGLIVPHIMKNIYKKSADKLILPIFFYGGAFLVFCDILARTIASSDLPIGVVTSFLGAPFFIYLIVKK
jgi:iron complex transport system permease protein